MQIQLGLKHLEGGSLIPFNACIGGVTVHTIISFTKSNAVKTKSRFWENVDSLILHCRQRDVTIHTYISFIKNNCSKKQDLDLRNVDSVTLQRRQKKRSRFTLSFHLIKSNATTTRSGSFSASKEMPSNLVDMQMEIPM